MSTPVLLGVKEAAARLGLSVGTTYNWVSARRLTTVHVGRRVFIPESEVARVIANGTTYAQGQAPVRPLAAARVRLRTLGRVSWR